MAPLHHLLSTRQYQERETAKTGRVQLATHEPLQGCESQGPTRDPTLIALRATQHFRSLFSEPRRVSTEEDEVCRIIDASNDASEEPDPIVATVDADVARQALAEMAPGKTTAEDLFLVEMLQAAACCDERPAASMALAFSVKIANCAATTNGGIRTVQEQPTASVTERTTTASAAATTACEKGVDVSAVCARESLCSHVHVLTPDASPPIPCARAVIAQKVVPARADPEEPWPVVQLKLLPNALETFSFAPPSKCPFQLALRHLSNSGISRSVAHLVGCVSALYFRW